MELLEKKKKLMDKPTIILIDRLKLKKLKKEGSNGKNKKQS